MGIFHPENSINIDIWRNKERENKKRPEAVFLVMSDPSMNEL
jgi:hypothetical protein